MENWSEKIMAYIDGEMSLIERCAFEQELKVNSLLQEDYIEKKALIDKFENYRFYNMHIEEEYERDYGDSKQDKEINIGESRGTIERHNYIRRIAATIALLVFVLVGLIWNNSPEKQPIQSGQLSSTSESSPIPPQDNPEIVKKDDVVVLETQLNKKKKIGKIAKNRKKTAKNKQGKQPVPVLKAKVNNGFVYNPIDTTNGKIKKLQGRVASAQGEDIQGRFFDVINKIPKCFETDTICKERWALAQKCISQEKVKDAIDIINIIIENKFKMGELTQNEYENLKFKINKIKEE